METMKALLLMTCLFSHVAVGQDTKAPVFEVAAVKPSPKEPPTLAERAAGRRPGFQVTGDRLDAREVPVRFLLGRAYQAPPIYVLGEDWLDTKYDVAAKLPAGSSDQQVPDMLRNLFETRFGVRMHRETRAMPVYVLKRGAGGVRMKELPPDTPFSVTYTPTQVVASATLQSIGGVLGLAGLERRTINQTGLTATYEIPFDRMLIFGGTRNSLDDSDALARIQEALEPLGLTIARAQETTEVVVIDHIEHTPSDN